MPVTVPSSPRSGETAAIVHEHAAERRIVGERLDVALVEGLGLDELPDPVGELARYDALALQSPEPLEHDRGGDDRAQDDRPHDRAAGQDDFPHGAG